MEKTISYKNQYGNYKVVTKEFKDEKHLDNWYTFMSGRGYKIISIL